MCVWRMWGSGTQQSATWGWPPPHNSISNETDHDPSQGWAEAAALWAQQRQIREQYQNGNDSISSNLPPPLPPGPPPVRPTIPPVDHPPPDTTSGQPIVHDYMHGKQQPLEIIDYQHGKSFNAPSTIPNNMNFELVPETDYAQTTDNSKTTNEIPGTQEDGGQEWEVTSDNWFEYHPTGQEFYNGGWNQEGWNGDQAQYYAAAAQYYQNEYANTNPPPAPTPLMEARVKGRHDRSSFGSSRDSNKHHKLDNSSYQRRSSDNKSVQDDGETAKRKVLPLWLRQGLEKMEQEKKKALEKSKAMEKSSNANKFVNEDNSESDPEIEKRKEDEECPSSDVAQLKKQTSESEGEQEDEETKYQEMMMKVKTWMTEILLGVTNKEMRNICSEVYFEFKRSLKVKATQVRRSGGLDALRSAGVDGDGNITPSESEDEEVKTALLTSPKNELELEEENSNSPILGKSEKRTLINSKTECESNLEKDSSKLSESNTPPTQKKSLPVKKLPKKYSSSHSDNDSDSSIDLSPSEQKPMKRKKRTPPAAYRSGSNSKDNENERSKYFRMLMKQSKKESSTSEEESNSNESDNSSEPSESELSSDSEEETKRTKSKKRQKTLRQKKSKRRRKRSSSEDSSRKKKKRKNESSSSDESVRRIKKKSGKKRRHKKSPSYYKKKR